VVTFFDVFDGDVFPFPFVFIAFFLFLFLESSLEPGVAGDALAGYVEEGQGVGGADAEVAGEVAGAGAGDGELVGF